MFAQLAMGAEDIVSIYSLMRPEKECQDFDAQAGCSDTSPLPQLATAAEDIVSIYSPTETREGVSRL
ncbi:hypothetical protein RRG08_022178 [Elysia crispata]|uniref:Uncharacterized protein n=1 Tax=Elysia crispata TaxID=231223 RepID=A0AAE1AIQ6_9GAST|nr:hypothetical protein RRG08_022178 [Elysia crispata]